MNINKMKVCGLEVHTERKQIKNMYLGVYPPEGKIRVAAPAKMDEESIRLFIISKTPWIKKQKIKFEQQQRQTKREFVSGESHYFLGRRYRLNVIFTDDKPRVDIKRKNYIDLYIKSNMTIKQRENIIEKYYRAELRKRIPLLLKKWENIIGVTVNEVGIKKMKTKWGSCNPNSKRIWINLELAKTSIECLEYILVHEMTHFHENSHSNRFFNLLNSYMPQWNKYRDELNNSVLGFFHWKY